jgi:saccharopine dehydrogenase-like NADP-dependent oxidoreductase
MHRVLLLGAGKIGSAIAKFLASTGDYDVLVADVDERALSELTGLKNLRTQRTDSTDTANLDRAMHERDSVVVAMHSELNISVARAALKNGLSYFDLTEDVATARLTMELAEQARDEQVFVPQCGLAPGFVSTAAGELIRQFDQVDSVALRVGALPVYPSNALKYNLTWSTDGLINEYCNRCDAIEHGKLVEVPGLEGLEHFALDGIEYEAFNTSGGVGTLAKSLEGKVRSLNYKTVRYPGHRDLIQFLFNDLRLRERKKILSDILEYSLPTTPQDVVLIFISVSGMKNGRLTQISDARRIYHRDVLGEPWSAIQITTAAGICAVLDLHAVEHRFPRGFVRQEEIGLKEFLSNRFGRYYVTSGDKMPMNDTV